MRLKCLYALLFCFLIITGSGETIQNIDSLKTKLRSTNERDSVKFTLLKHICNYYSDNSMYDSVLTYAELAINTAILQKNAFYEIKFYSTVGVAYWNKSDYDKAILSYEKGIKRIEETGISTNLSVLYNNIGLAYWDKADLPKALNYFTQSYELDNKNHDNQGMSSSLLNIGLVYSDMGDTKNALRYYFQAIRMYTILGDEQSKALAYINIGQLYSNLKNKSKSMEYNLKALRIAEKYNDSRNLAFVYNNIGSIYYDDGKHDEALGYFEKGLKLYELIGEKSGQTLALNNIGNTFCDKKDFKKAIEVFSKALVIETDHQLLEDESTTRFGLAHAYASINDFKKAFENFQIYNKLNDTINALKNLSELNNIQKTMELKQKEIELTVEKEKELAIKDAEKQKQVFIIVGIIIILVLTLIFAAFLYKRFQITSRQKDIIEKQKHLVEEHQKEILDSIHYAKRIQYTLLAHDDLLKQNMNDHFVLFKPKDVVSGDFYWATKKGNKFYLAVCDSTGHGVPGAFMSLLNISFLNEAITEKNIEQPHLILNHVRQRLIENISKDGGQDGMDGILICMDKSNGEVTYAAANNAPLIISQGIITELYTDKMPVGKGERTDSFQLNKITTHPGDMIYLYTDGFADQFGGPKGKKYKYKQLNDLLLNNSNQPLHEQKEILNSSFDNWKGKLEQIDDVCIIGVRV